MNNEQLMHIINHAYAYICYALHHIHILWLLLQPYQMLIATLYISVLKSINSTHVAL